LIEEASRALVLLDRKWVRSTGSGKELGSELYGAMLEKLPNPVFFGKFI